MIARAARLLQKLGFYLRRDGVRGLLRRFRGGRAEPDDF